MGSLENLLTRHDLFRQGARQLLMNGARPFELDDGALNRGFRQCQGRSGLL